jgi:hypothetical protein
MMRIIRHLAIKFQLGLSKRFEQLADCVYMGGSVTSMYVPFTGSELEDDEDLRDKTFSCDDEVIIAGIDVIICITMCLCSHAATMKATR